MARIVAQWLNDERTLGVDLDSDGNLFLRQRGNGIEVWGPPIKLNPHNFEATGTEPSVNLVGVSWYRDR